MTENTPKLDEFKKHVKDHKKAYILVGTGMCIGFGIGVVATMAHTKSIMTGVGSTSAQVGDIYQLGYKSTQTLKVSVSALGDPGNVIQDLTTGIIYASQGQAARELGVSANRISEQLRGVREDAGGHIFKILGKASSLVTAE